MPTGGSQIGAPLPSFGGSHVGGGPQVASVPVASILTTANSFMNALLEMNPQIQMTGTPFSGFNRSVPMSPNYDSHTTTGLGHNPTHATDPSSSRGTGSPVNPSVEQNIGDQPDLTEPADPMTMSPLDPTFGPTAGVIGYYGDAPSTPAPASSSQGSHTHGAHDEDVASDGVETNLPADPVVNNEELSLDVELALLDVLPNKRAGLRGSGVGLTTTRVEEDRPEVGLTLEDNFSHPKAVSTIADNLKKIMRNSHTTYRDFSTLEKEETWFMFPNTFRFEKALEGRVRITYDRICQDRFSDAMHKVKTFWLTYKKDPGQALKNSTWASHTLLKDYIVYWRTDKARERSRKASENRNKRKGPNYVGGSISTSAWRERMAKDRGIDPALIPQHEVWLKTHCKKQTNGTWLWANKWCHDVFMSYIEDCRRTIGEDISLWEPINIAQWFRAVKGARKNYVPGFATHGDPEIVGFICRKKRRYVDMGATSMEVIEQQKKLKTQEEELAAAKVRITTQEAAIAREAAICELMAQRMGFTLPPDFLNPQAAQNPTTQPSVTPTTSANDTTQTNQPPDDVYVVPPFVQDQHHQVNSRDFDHQ